MFWLAPHYLNLEQQDLVIVVSWQYLPSYLSNDLTALLVSPLMSWFFLIVQYHDLLPPLHITNFWNIVRTTYYQELPLVTCQLNYWQIFFSTRCCLSLWLTIKRLPIVTFYCFHMHVTLTITSFNLSQYVMVDGWDVNWKKWNKCWSILFWSSCCQACCNFLDSPSSVLCVWCFVMNINYSQ